MLCNKEILIYFVMMLWAKILERIFFLFCIYECHFIFTFIYSKIRNRFISSRTWHIYLGKQEEVIHSSKNFAFFCLPNTFCGLEGWVERGLLPSLVVDLKYSYFPGPGISTLANSKLFNTINNSLTWKIYYRARSSFEFRIICLT